MPREYLEKGAAAVVVERPKVVFNQRTGKYVMWVHLDVAENLKLDRCYFYLPSSRSLSISLSAFFPFARACGSLVYLRA